MPTDVFTKILNYLKITFHFFSEENKQSRRISEDEFEIQPIEGV